eukprot:CAMPEP_0206260150 /NCGR_PEP_ID=MMETSP0047_2-20121206/26918_1 /ASSEMBLY_ACC=CAM_ASM_000192 /TAXON_ID=195065 /ORGANISM="Chroomonas mesostigmatica_cf, Strain CCMP1168" /LENGTH=166 /DNA_ID=CAMNT_0053687179 /DNA_START=168 /DNA_END=668 /DNA_ORIENTATION=+
MSWSEMQHAAYSGNFDVLVEQLEKPGANPDEIDGQGRTLLIHAAAQGHTQIVRALLMYGADVNFAPSTGDGRTALHWAALNQHMKCCELLQSAGADGGAEDRDSVTPQDLSVMAAGDFIIIPDVNPIPLKELQQARVRVDPDSFPILHVGEVAEHGGLSGAKSVKK